MADKSIDRVVDTQLGVIGVLTLLLDQDLDAQIDEVVKLVRAYDGNHGGFTQSLNQNRVLVPKFEGKEIWDFVKEKSASLVCYKNYKTEMTSRLLKLAAAG
ncbi:unnamed protein product, partial [Discosporangium mesarthrocarpum]